MGTGPGLVNLHEHLRKKGSGLEVRCSVFMVFDIKVGSTYQMATMFCRSPSVPNCLLQKELAIIKQRLRPEGGGGRRAISLTSFGTNPRGRRCERWGWDKNILLTYTSIVPFTAVHFSSYTNFRWTKATNHGSASMRSINPTQNRFIRLFTYAEKKPGKLEYGSGFKKTLIIQEISKPSSSTIVCCKFLTN